MGRFVHVVDPNGLVESLQSGTHGAVVLGFAMNPKGYALFMRMLRDFAMGHAGAGSENPNIGRLEARIFWLVRQHVRSST